MMVSSTIWALVLVVFALETSAKQHGVNGSSSPIEGAI